MKKTISILLLFTALFFSCKKAVQQQEENAALSIMTNGTWQVTQYLQDSVNITASLSQYSFQFNANGTVTGTNGIITVTGTWTTNIANRTITSNFPAGSGAVNELDAVWTITNSSTTSVVAYSTVNSTTNNLQLQKE